MPSPLDRTFGLTGKVGIVTGAGKGIGRSAALGLAEAGCDLAVVSRTSADLDEVAGAIEAEGRRALPLVADLSQTDEAATIVDQVVKHFGQLDVLVNNAGVSRRADVFGAPLDDLSYMLDLNLKSVFVLCQDAINHMRLRNQGKIINVTSITAMRGNPGSVLYGSTKGALMQLTRGLAVELAREGVNIQVNAVGPGCIGTPLAAHLFEDQGEAGHQFREFVMSRVPMGRAGEPEELQGAFIMLASAASNYITGQTIYVDGGWTSCA